MPERKLLSSAMSTPQPPPTLLKKWPSWLNVENVRRLVKKYGPAVKWMIEKAIHVATNGFVGATHDCNQAVMQYVEGKMGGKPALTAVRAAPIPSNYSWHTSGAKVRGSPYSGNGTMEITHTEFLGTQTSSADGSFLTQSYVINPGNATTFPVFNSIARNFESYVVDSITIEAKSDLPATVSGTVSLAVDYNVDDAHSDPFAIDEQFFLNTEGVVSTSVWTRNVKLSLKRARMARFNQYYVADDSKPLDPLADCAVVYLATDGVGYNGVPSQMVTAKIFIHYRIRLINPVPHPTAPPPPPVAAIYNFQSFAGFYSASNSNEPVPFNGSTVEMTTGAGSMSNLNRKWYASGRVITSGRNVFGVLAGDAAPLGTPITQGSSGYNTYYLHLFTQSGPGGTLPAYDVPYGVYIHDAGNAGGLQLVSPEITDYINCYEPSYAPYDPTVMRKTTLYNLRVPQVLPPMPFIAGDMDSLDIPVGDIDKYYWYSFYDASLSNTGSAFAGVSISPTVVGDLQLATLLRKSKSERKSQLLDVEDFGSVIIDPKPLNKPQELTPHPDPIKAASGWFVKASR